MKNNRIFKIVSCLVLALAMVVTTVALPYAKVSAASKYNAYIMYSDANWAVTNFDTKVANGTIKNKKGTQHVTLTLKYKDCKVQNKDVKSTTAVKATQVFVVDVCGIVKDYKVAKADGDKEKKNKISHLKFSNVVIKADGKAVKINSKYLYQGWIEDNTKDYNYRLDIWNAYNYSGETGPACAKKTAFNFKKSLTVSFDFTIK